MHRWSPLNAQQRLLLDRLNSGGDLGTDASQRRSAYALRDRGLLAVQRSHGALAVEVTAAGKFYLEHGHHPDHPAYQDQAATATPQSVAPRRVSPAEAKPARKAQQTAADADRTPKPKKPYSERPIARARRAKATELIERLVQEGTIRIRDADAADMTEWRRVIDYAKRHNLVPTGKRIEKSGVRDTGLDISLIDGVHANVRLQPHEEARPVPVPVPGQLRAPHPVVAALRGDANRLAMPAQSRHRALRLLQGLAAEAVRQGHEVREREDTQRPRTRGYSYNGQFFPPSHARRDGEIDLLVEGFTYTVTIQQEFPQSTDPERSEILTIELGYHHAGRKRHGPKQTEQSAGRRPWRRRRSRPSKPSWPSFSLIKRRVGGR